ncbi:MAG: tyrosine-type recombinase/integrase [Candidatus Thiodiazotropha sp. 'RUGA']|nr:tyrosine-type recombinase/integrase [Candidatus Thiodiazotropha sp. 'RUGA']
MKFTDRKIKNLKPKSERYEVWEGNGLGMRVTPKGVKSWVFMYRFQEKARRLTLGRYPKMTVAEAHSEHGKALLALEKGIDPGKVEVEKRRENRRAPTVKMLVEEYIEKWAKPRKRSWKKDQSTLDRDVVSEWGRRKAKDITRRDVVILLDGIVDRGAPIQANRTLAVIRKMFNFAVSRDIVASNPCLQVKPPAPENQRDRTLSADEIKTLWNELDRVGLKSGNDEEKPISMSKGTALALQFQLLTAQRKGEVAAAEWSEVDLEGKVWTIPAEKSKNNLPHRVPLSPQAVSLLEPIKKESKKSIWLFPSPRGQGKKHILETAIDHAVRLNQEHIGVNHWVPHDLRRTAASMMTSIGISRLVVSKILNHVESGITAVYDRHSYDAEKRNALEAWGRKLDQILIGGNKGKVIPIHNAS